MLVFVFAFVCVCACSLVYTIVLRECTRVFWRGVCVKECVGCVCQNVDVCLCRTHTHTDIHMYRESSSSGYTATHCNTLPHTATHCNTLQHTATHCNTLQHTATHCTTLQHTATHCNTLYHTATHCITLQHTATYCNTLEASEYAPASSSQNTATHCNTLQHTATHCTTLQHNVIHLKPRRLFLPPHCIILQHTATHHSLEVCTYLLRCHLYPSATHCNTLQHAENTATIFLSSTVDIFNTLYSQLQIGWHRILRLFCKTLNLVRGATGFSYGLQLVPCYYMVLIVNLVDRILVR